jgi:predicted nuclease of predicted toxin-antitoxin system
VSQLFVSVFLDEDVSTLIATLLRSRGYESESTRDAGRLGATDAEQLAFAAGRRMAILTHNRQDSEELDAEYRTSGRHHCGIIIAVRRDPYEIFRRLVVVLDQYTADEMDDQVLYI